MVRAQTVECVVKQGLCTGCGTCAGICPFNAIKMVAYSSGNLAPQLTINCTHCGLCLRVCSGNTVDLKGLNIQVFGKEPQNKLIGNFIKCYAGFSTDSDIRLNAASGGLVTSILTFALQEGLIDGVIVTRMCKRNPLKPQVFIARTVSEIISAQGSKYCPVPVNAAIREVLRVEGKYAVVGLPCHIQSLRKAEAVIPALKQRIVLHLGIFCSHTTDFKGTEFLLHKQGIKTETVSEISYRGGGWPGAMTVKMNDGQTRKIPYRSYSTGLFNLFFFTPKRCLLCSDMTCEFADISFGDAWLPEFSKDETGTSIAIARTSLGKKYLESAVAKQAITLKELKVSQLLKEHANRGTMRLKKSSQALSLPFILLQKQTPVYSNVLLRSRPRDFLISMQAFVNAEISSNPKMWSLIPLMSRVTKIAAKSARR
jgi:coenzyme F420 hydrogenase subunit beta